MRTTAHPRLLLVLTLLTLVLALACAPRTAAGRQVSGCAEAVGERSSAIAAIDLAAEQAVARNPARAEQLKGIAAEGKRGITAAADLGSCDDRSGTRGIAVDAADLRTRYRVIVDRTAVQLTPPRRSRRSSPAVTTRARGRRRLTGTEVPAAVSPQRSARSGQPAAVSPS